jgi:hypothetical protein
MEIACLNIGRCDMEKLFLNVQEECLSQEAINILKKVRKRYKKIELHQYINWCIIKNIDIKISSEILIQYLNLIRNNKSNLNSVIDEFSHNLQCLANKKTITSRDQNKAYEIMNDIVFILHKGYTRGGEINERIDIKYILRKLMNWVRKKIKFQ